MTTAKTSLKVGQKDRKKQKNPPTAANIEKFRIVTAKIRKENRGAYTYN